MQSYHDYFNPQGVPTSRQSNQHETHLASPSRPAGMDSATASFVDPSLIFMPPMPTRSPADSAAGGDYESYDFQSGMKRPSHFQELSYGPRQSRKRARIEPDFGGEIYDAPGLPNATCDFPLREITREEAQARQQQSLMEKEEQEMRNFPSETLETPTPASQAGPKVKATSAKSKPGEDPKMTALVKRVKKWIFETQRGNASSNQSSMLDILDGVESDAEKTATLREFQGAGKKTHEELSTYKLLLSRWRNWLANAWTEKKLPVVQAALELLALIPLSDEMLDELKLRKVFNLIVKKDSGSLKSLAETILGDAKTVSSKMKASESSTSKRVDSSSSFSKQNDPNAPDKPDPGAINAKNPRVPVKSSVGPPSTSSSSAPTSKAKPKVATTANTSFFTSLQQPSGQQKSRPSASIPKPPTAPPQKPSAATTRPSSGFASAYASIKQSKNPATTESPKAPEVVVEKPGKIRKSVSWKAEKDLVEVKVFEHVEPDYSDGLYVQTEEFGELRDLDRHEGMDLRKSARAHLLEEEEEDDMPWETPKDIDLSEVPQADTKGVKRGGTITPSSEEAKIQESRNQSILLIHYVSESDIPPSPREPPEEPSPQNVSVKEIPLPLNLKQSQAAQLLLQENSALFGHQNYPFANVNNINQPPNMEQLMQILQSVNAQNQQHSNQFTGVSGMLPQPMGSIPTGTTDWAQMGQAAAIAQTTPINPTNSQPAAENTKSVKHYPRYGSSIPSNDSRAHVQDGSMKVKNMNCNFWIELGGYCRNGDTCRFAHPVNPENYLRTS